MHGLLLCETIVDMLCWTFTFSITCFEFCAEPLMLSASKVQEKVFGSQESNEDILVTADAATKNECFVDRSNTRQVIYNSSYKRSIIDDDNVNIANYGENFKTYTTTQHIGGALFF